MAGRATILPLAPRVLTPFLSRKRLPTKRQLCKVADILKANRVRVEPLSKLSVNVSQSYARRLRKLRAQHGISASSMVEAALAAYLEGQSDAVIARRARDAGATLRREPAKR